MRKFYTLVLSLMLCITIFETTTGKGRVICCTGNVCTIVAEF
jgi:hypothetical protein